MQGIMARGVVARGIVAFCALAMLSGCMSTRLWHQAGVRPARAQSDLTDCRVAALNKVPRDIRTRVTPAQFVPPRHFCRPAGGDLRCALRPGYWRGGHRESYDANLSLREDVEDQCMTARGYTQVELPHCSPAQIAGARATARLPRLTESACAAKLTSGEWTVLTPN